LGLINGPGVFITERILKAMLVGLLDTIAVFLIRDALAGCGVLKEESIVHVTSGVTLRLEQSVEIPERALYESGGRHLIEPHAQKNLTELRSDLHQRVQVTTSGVTSSRLPVLLLELLLFPRSRADHVSSECGRKLNKNGLEAFALVNLESFSSDDGQ